MNIKKSLYLTTLIVTFSVFPTGLSHAETAASVEAPTVSVDGDKKEQVESVENTRQNETESLVLESEWIHSKPGYTEGTLGLQFHSIESTDEHQKVMIVVPEHMIESMTDIEEVVVTGQVPEPIDIELQEPEVRTRAKAEFVRDYENDNYGLMIYLHKKQKWPVRLYFDAEQ